MEPVPYSQLEAALETAKGKTREEIVNRLADRIDTFERYAQPHSRLIAALSTRLAHRFGLPAADVAAIDEAAMLHDIGLWAMSPAYHSQPAPLSFEARLDLWRHPVIGEQQMVKREAGRHAQLLVRWHHEWWNGSGYPDSLAFEDIPIAARIIRAVELYSALVCERPYRQALGDEHAAETLASSAGLECDPYVVKALMSLLEELREPAGEAVDTPSLGAPAPDRPVAHPVEALPQFFDANAQQTEPIQAPVSEEHAIDPASSPDIRIGIRPSDEFTLRQPLSDTVAAGDAQSAPPEPQNVARPRSVDLLLSRAQSEDAPDDSRAHWCAWSGSRYNRKPLVGFQASVLRQIEFRSIALPFWSEARLDWYLRLWGKLIFANDSRAWAATVARARVEAADPLDEESIARVLHDVYVPGVRLANPSLARWFGETDAWWLDNLRRNVEALEVPGARAQAMTIGLHTGDYALSFSEETRELRRPLTTIFWRLAGRDLAGAAVHPHNRTFNQPAEEFIRQARADLLFLNLPPSHPDRGGADARSEWREAWVTGAAGTGGVALPQSRQAYLSSVDRLLRVASNFRTWAVEYQEPGLASAQDVLDLIKEYRPVRATYSKDVTEVLGGLRSYIIVADASAR